MAIKKTSNVKAEFSMSSLTDIIFLLLIFFLLTSNFVTPNAIKLVLPKANSDVLAKQTLFVYIDENNEFQIEYPKGNIEEVEKSQLETALSQKLKSYEDYDATIVIHSDEDIPIKEITDVMSMGNRIKQKVILATKRE